MIDVHINTLRKALLSYLALSSENDVSCKVNSLQVQEKLQANKYKVIQPNHLTVQNHATWVGGSNPKQIFAC